MEASTATGFTSSVQLAARRPSVTRGVFFVRGAIRFIDGSRLGSASVKQFQQRASGIALIILTNSAYGGILRNTTR